MDKFEPAMGPHFQQLLAQRAVDLTALLQRGDNDGGVIAPEREPEVTDFKQLANEQAQTVVRDVQEEHARHELEQVHAAQRRLRTNQFGDCLECGEPIDLRRLEFLPAAPYCAVCQAGHEHP